MEYQKIFCSLILILIFLISFSSAITGSIGNARMILRTSEGETIEKYVLVKNVNDVVVDIELFASGDLEKDIEIRDKTFSLEPGTEKRAYFDIEVNEAGTTETAMNVKFSPTDGGNGVGLMSTIIVIAEESEGWSFWGKDDDSDTDDNKEENSTKGDSYMKNVDVSSGALILFLLALFVVLLIIVAVILAKSKSKKDVRKK